MTGNDFIRWYLAKARINEREKLLKKINKCMFELEALEQETLQQFSAISTDAEKDCAYRGCYHTQESQAHTSLRRAAQFIRDTLRLGKSSQ